MGDVWRRKEGERRWKDEVIREGGGRGGDRKVAVIQRQTGQGRGGRNGEGLG